MFLSVEEKKIIIMKSVGFGFGFLIMFSLGVMRRRDMYAECRVKGCRFVVNGENNGLSTRQGGSRP